jgi:hypothetical protein
VARMGATICHMGESLKGIDIGAARAHDTRVNTESNMKYIAIIFALAVTTQAHAATATNDLAKWQNTENWEPAIAMGWRIPEGTEIIGDMIVTDDVVEHACNNS